MFTPKYTRSAFRVRLIEWVSSFVILGIGLISLLNPLTFYRPALIEFLPYATLWTWLCLAIGSVRLLALYINGSWKETPLFRLIGSIAGAGVFGFLLGNLLQDPNGFSWGVSTYAVLMISELFASYFSASDLTYVHKPTTG